MKINSLSLMFFLFLSSYVLAAEIDINNASNLVNNKKYFDALKVVSPCLKFSSIKNIPNLEECLYTGESIAEEAIRVLNKKFQKAFDAGASFPTWEGLLPYKALGLELGYDSPGANIVYMNDFFKHLQAVFPKSKYRSEYEYVLIDRSASCNDWEDWINKLERYIELYPTGKYTLRAKLDLAMNYDDLWDLTHPQHNHYWTISFPKDESLSRTYREKALKIYKEIINTPDKRGLNNYEIEEVRQRLRDLPKDKVKQGIFILRGYD